MARTWSLPLVAAMAFVSARWKMFFRPEANSVVATVAQVMFAEVALGMAAPTAQICRFPTTSGPTMTMYSRHTAGPLQVTASGQGMVVVVGDEERDRIFIGTQTCVAPTICTNRQ